MRVKKEHVVFLKQSLKKYVPDAEVYLIGSRANDMQKGGDIDICVVGEKTLTSQEKRNVKIAFYKKFGEQKIDVISFKNGEPSNFKELALLDSVKI